MNRFASSLSIFALALRALSACSSGGGSVGDTSATSAVVAGPGSTDPMDHLNVIAADTMEGRGTGSAGFQRAADYVVGECVKAGLTGAFPASATPYLQPFTVGGFGSHLTMAEEHDDDAPHDFGNELFAQAIYLSGEASAETQAEMSEKVCAELDCPPGIDPRDVVGATRAATPTANNIVGLFPGSGPHKNEIILFSAHLDHLGKSASGLFPGADDNGSGSAVMLSLLHSVAAARATQPFDRTIAFLWTAGEEKGLLGAAYFADNAPASIPLARIKQNVNMDMVGYFDDTRFSVGTDGSAASTQTVAQIQTANATLRAPFAKMNQDIQQYKSRQDGYAFSRKHVPSVFVFEGLSNPNGGGNLMTNYHRTTDTLANFLANNNGTKIRKMALLLNAIATTLANAP